MRLAVAALAVVSLIGDAGCAPIPPRSTGEEALAAPLPDADDADLFSYRPQARPLQLGDEVPRFELVDASGTRFELSGLRGRAVILTFFAAPLDPAGGIEVLARLDEIDAAMGARLADRVVLIAMLIDETAGAADHLLDAHSAAARNAPHRRFARADPESTALLAAAFGVVFWKNADGSVGHTVSTFVIDPNGRYIDRFPGLDAWSAIDAVAAASLALDR